MVTIEVSDLSTGPIMTIDGKRYCEKYRTARTLRNKAVGYGRSMAKQRNDDVVVWYKDGKFGYSLLAVFGKVFVPGPTYAGHDFAFFSSGLSLST